MNCVYFPTSPSVPSFEMGGWAHSWRSYPQAGGSQGLRQLTQGIYLNPLFRSLTTSPTDRDLSTPRMKLGSDPTFMAPIIECMRGWPDGPHIYGKLGGTICSLLKAVRAGAGLPVAHIFLHWTWPSRAGGPGDPSSRNFGSINGDFQRRRFSGDSDGSASPISRGELHVITYRNGQE